MTQEIRALDKITVFYDGECPLCTREIGFYQRQSGATDIKWVDVTIARQDALPDGLDRQKALARFHVQNAAGELVSGGEAFSTLWSSLPAFRWTGQLFRNNFLTWFLEMAYRIFLPCRPLLQRFFSSPKSP